MTPTHHPTCPIPRQSHSDFNPMPIAAASPCDLDGR
jgi:hypothetical protein